MQDGEWLSQIPEWLRLILSGSVGGIMVVTINIILKRGINHKFDKALEHHKAELSRENEIMRQKSSHTLELARLERQIRYSGTYEKILNAIIQIHEKLIDIHKSIRDYVKIFGELGDATTEERRKNLCNQIDIFWKIYNTNRILLPEELDKEITNYIHSVSDKALAFMIHIEKPLKTHDQHINKAQEQYEKWDAINEEVNKQWNTTLYFIRNQFKNILGVEPNFEAGKKHDIKSTEIGGRNINPRQ